MWETWQVRLTEVWGAAGRSQGPVDAAGSAWKAWRLSRGEPGREAWAWLPFPGPICRAGCWPPQAPPQTGSAQTAMLRRICFLREQRPGTRAVRRPF